MTERIWGLRVIETEIVPRDEIWIAGPCSRPKGHTGACGEAQTREERGVYLGQCREPSVAARLIHAATEDTPDGD